ncbi:ABC transporter ATP-binding protein [bacterium]|nr:ABC transporter ATP-binding protein [bacterium]
MVTIRDWTVQYPDATVAIDRLSLQIEDGERLALIGANGAGKSTLILSLVGILPGSGEVTIEGLTLNKSNITEIRTKAGVIFQNPDDQLFLPTIYDDVAFGPRNLGLDEESVRHRVEDRLELLNIAHLRERSALKLSGGEKRMAAIATVLAMKPDVMLMDEPTAFLDPKSRRCLIKLLQTLPHTMLIATHDLAFAAEVCSRCLILKDGRYFADGPTQKLLYDAEKMDAAGLEAIS